MMNYYEKLAQETLNDLDARLNQKMSPAPFRSQILAKAFRECAAQAFEEAAKAIKSSRLETPANPRVTREHRDALAAWCYGYADVMLRERGEREGGG